MKLPRDIGPVHFVGIGGIGVSGATSRPAPVIPDLSPGESGEFSPASRDPLRLMISEPQ